MSLFLRYMSSVFTHIFPDHYSTLFYAEKYVHWNSIQERQSEPQEFKHTERIVQLCVKIVGTQFHSLNAIFSIKTFFWCRKILLGDNRILAQYFIQVPSESRFKGPHVKWNKKHFRWSFIPSAIHHLNSLKEWWQCCEDHKSLVNAALCVCGCCHKYNFCRDKGFVTTNTCLSWQKYATKLCRDKIFLSQQAYFYHDKTCVLSWQTCVCHDKMMFVATNICRDKSFVAPNTSSVTV